MFTTNQITSALVAYRSAADQDTATASSIAAALLSYYTIAQVDGLLAGKPVRFPDDGGADEAVAAIGEQILGPTDVSLSNWTVRPSSGCSVVLATHAAGAVSVDGYTLTLAANPWNIVRTYNLTPGRELLFACQYRLGTASNFVVYMSEADNPPVRQLRGRPGCLEHCQDVLHSASKRVAKLHFGAHFQVPDGRNGGRLRPPETGNTAEVEENTAVSALLLKHEFLDGGADDVTLATLGARSPFWCAPTARAPRVPAGGLRHDPAWNIVRTYTLTPGRRYSFGCRYRLGTASNLVMYVSAADNDYVGVTGTFLGTAAQGVWSTARLDFSVPPGVALRSFRRLDPRAGYSRSP